MAGKTNTERIQELSDKIAAHMPYTELKLQDLRREIDSLAGKFTDSASDLQSARRTIAVLEQRIEHLEQRAQEAPSSRIAVVEQRCAQIEKQSDRRWQVWLAILGSFLALLIAVLRK